MKLSIGRLATVALATAALSAGACAMDEGPEIGSNSGDELGGLLFGQPLGIDFSAGLVVNQVDVQVAKGWLNSDNFSLAVNIDGVNDGYHHHGYQEVSLNATELLGEDRAIALVRIPWTADSTPTHTEETYTVCVEILTDAGNVLGDPMCGVFGPY